MVAGAEVPHGAPNVVLVVLDDTGFAHLGCYGSTIETPNIDALAAGGLRFTGFHTTALCSPTRACLLTGRNHHAVGMRAISNFDTGFPNMRGAIPRSAATLAEILRDNGYATFAAGKWHLAPMAECSAAGPYTNWPLQKGFDRYYGFLQGETDQFFPELTCDNHFVDPPGTADDGYHVSEDIVDRSIGHGARPDLAGARAAVLPLPGVRRDALAAPGAAKLSARSIAAASTPAGTWRARNGSRGRSNGHRTAGDEARAAQSRREAVVGAVGRTSSAFAARLQEAFAAMLDHTDAQIGRLVAFLKSIDRWDNTLFVAALRQRRQPGRRPDRRARRDEVVQRHPRERRRGGRAARRHRRPGQPLQHPLGLGAGRQHAAEVVQAEHPRRRRARPADRALAGGARSAGGRPATSSATRSTSPRPSWTRWGSRPPSVVAGVPQMPVHGVSLAPAFADPTRGASAARSTSRCSAIAASGRTAGRRSPTTTAGTPFDDDTWELYHLDEDFSEHDDLAARNPSA